jgi:hypothetical protein
MDIMTIKGPQLFEKLRGRIAAAEASFYYAITQLSREPSSPIAKVEEGQGYYLRPKSERALNYKDARKLRQFRLLAVSMASHYKGLTAETPRGEWHAQMAEFARTVDTLAAEDEPQRKETLAQ